MSAEYRVVKFVPDPVRAEPLNIGLLMYIEDAVSVSVPTEALERAARWCSSLDRSGFAALGDRLGDELVRAVHRAEDLGELDSAFLPDHVGAVYLSEPRRLDLDDTSPERRAEVFRFLVDRLVMPPKQVVYGGGDNEARKLAKSIGAAVRTVVPSAATFEPVVGRSGRPYVADVYLKGDTPLIVSALVPSSGWQGVRLLEAKAFEMYDIRRSLGDANLAVCCKFPELDPANVRLQAEQIFETVDVRVVSPSEVVDVARSMAAAGY